MACAMTPKKVVNGICKSCSICKFSLLNMEVEDLALYLWKIYVSCQIIMRAMDDLCVIRI